MTQRLYEKLIVWKEAHALSLMIYRLTKSFPSDERFGLTSQMRRAGSSVPMNIAEGNAHRSPKQKQHFLTIAYGSLEEVHYQALLARDLSFLTHENFDDIDDRVNRIGYLLTNLRKSLS